MVRRFLFERGFILPVMVVGVIPTVVVAATAALRSVSIGSVAEGVPFFAVGFSLLVWTTQLFDAHGGALAPWNPPKDMVRKGPYRYLRNPMILGIFLMLAGEAAAFRSPFLGAWFSVFFIGQQIYIRFDEEPSLRARFGASYERYCSEVPRWLPRLSRSKAQD
jgi:protein-S-isoprenylcysteine O-methyltransferase Ste14